MPVVDAVDGTTLEPNRVYAPPPYAVVGLRDKTIAVQAPEAEDGRPSRAIDSFSTRWV